MPKQKRVSSAHLARQAKKRKRNQREDPVKRQREQERNAAARRQLRINNPERRQEERQYDAASHRQNRQHNLDRRLDEQQRDTIGSKITCALVYFMVILYQQLTESHVRIQFEEWMSSSVTP